MGTEPANGGYMVAAYVIVTMVVFGYAFSLWRRARRVLKD
ncbi:MAG: hypothetical protein H6R40_1422 [Gemmatimonadetes bacterium]|nr:hypothetical protein [Gemmatimonadota bacterium]